jgi:hypothetical protein
VVVHGGGRWWWWWSWSLVGRTLGFCHPLVPHLTGHRTGTVLLCVCRSFEKKAKKRAAQVSRNPRSKNSPLYKLKFPAAVPPDAISQPEMKDMLPPGASVWQGRLGSGAWCSHLPPHPRISRSWALAGHREAAMFVLRHIWSLWLHDQGLQNTDCPVAGVF